MREHIRIGLVSISDRASEGTYQDQGIPALQDWLGKALTSPWTAETRLIPDERVLIERTLVELVERAGCNLVLTTGGTGPAVRDVTPEALDRLKTAGDVRDIPGFGELFRMISYRSIGTSTVQSRACAVVARGTYIFALPGSNGAVKDGWDGILAEQLDSRNCPCNFVDLMPRLREK